MAEIATSQNLSSLIINKVPSQAVFEQIDVQPDQLYFIEDDGIIYLSEIANADDLKAIEALTGTSGFLKKTAANTWTLDNSTYALSGHTHNYAGSSSAGGAADSVAKSLVLKINSGTTEGTSLYTFNGSAAKTLNIKPGDNISFNTASGELTITAVDTWIALSGATSSADGTAGYVSAPPHDGYNTKFLRADGTWAIPDYIADTHHTAYLYAGANNATKHAAVSAGTNIYLCLRENGTQRSAVQIKQGTNMTISSDANGIITFTAKDTTYSNFVKSGTGAAAGLVPSPGTTAGTTRFLREDGTWSVPSYTTNTDTKVTQTISSTENADYRILLSGTADDTTRAEGARKDTDFKYNPSTNTLTIGAGTLTATNYSGKAATAGTADSANAVAWDKVSGRPTSVVTSINGNSGAVTITAGDLNLSSALRFIGKTTSDMSESFTGVPAGITGYVTPIVGDVVLDKNNDAEYVCIAKSGSTYTWELLGRSGSWATSGHTHDISLSQTGTSTVSLTANTTYTLTAGGKSVVFKTPVDTTYENKSAAQNGTTLSLVTTGEKYIWNNKSNLTIGTTSTTAMAGNTVVTNVAISTVTGASGIKGYITFSSATSGNQSLITEESLYIYNTMANNVPTDVYLNVGKSKVQGGITLHSATNANAYGNLIPAVLTANTNPVWTLPNATGTIALESYVNTAIDGITYSDVGAAPSSTVSCTTANVKSALGTVSTTAKKFLKDTGSWVQVDWNDLSGIPSTFTPSSHEHDYIGKTGFIAYPSDGYKDYNVSSISGYIKIKIPQTKSATMFSFDVDIYNYVDSYTTRYHIAGYNYTNASWNACTAYCIAPITNPRANLTARFWSNGNDEMYVSIGETDTTWSYPKITIHNIVLSHSGNTLDKWKSGWTITIDDTSFDASLIKKTLSNTNIAYKTVAANLTTTTNAVAYYTDTAGTFGTKASANGALYATSTNGTLNWGTLPIAQGGTGATTATAARTNLNTVTGNARIFYGTCDTAAGTTLKEVICAEYDKTLTIGDMLIVKFSITNSGAVGSLQLTVKNSTSDASGTAAKNIKRQYNSTGANNLLAVGELNKDSISVFIYNGTYWILTNADYNNTYDNAALYSAAGANRTAESAANGGIGLHRYSLQMMTATYTWSSIASKDSTATSNTTDNNKSSATAAFLIDSPILYQDTNTNCAPGGAINVNGYTALGINLSYSTGTSSNTAGGLTIQRPVYLVGTLVNASTFKLDSTKWWTQTLPISSDDTKIYIYLGLAYSATNIYLSPVHPIYWHRNGELQLYNNYALTTSNLVANSETGNYARPIWFSQHDGTNVVNTKLGYNANFTYNPSTRNLNFTDNATITVNAGKTLGINTTTAALTLSSTTGATTISTTNGALEAKSTGSGTVKLTGTTGAMTISTTTGAITMQTNGSSGGNLTIKTANAGVISIQSVKSSISLSAATTMNLSSTTSTSISATTTMSISSTTSTTIAATTTMSISGTQGTTINSGSNYATLFKINNTEYGEFNKNGMFQLNDTGTQNTHKLYVNGNSAFNGKISFGEQASNVITEKAYMIYNATDNSIDFIFP